MSRHLQKEQWFLSALETRVESTVTKMNSWDLSTLVTIKSCQLPKREVDLSVMDNVLSRQLPKRTVGFGLPC